MSAILRAWILSITSLLTGVYALHTVYATRTSAFTKGNGAQLNQQVVELETPANAQAVLDLLRHDEPGVEPLQREQYWVGLGLDNIFLFLYPLQLLALLAFASRANTRVTARVLLACSALTIVAGAGCDWQENHHISRLLTYDLSQPVIDATRRWSLAKWTLVGIAYFSAAIALHTYIKSPPKKAERELPPMGPWRLRIIAVALLVAGISSIWGAVSFLWQGDFRGLLATSVHWAGVAVVACATFRPHRNLETKAILRRD